MDRNRKQPRRSRLRAALLGFVAVALTLGSLLQFDGVPDSDDATTAAVCGQADPLVPSSGLRSELEDLYTSSPFVNQAAEWLGGAVRIPYVPVAELVASD